MIRIDIHEAKTHLSRYLARLEAGETVVICRRNVPIAELRALPAERGAVPAPGLWQGRLVVPDTFFEPLPPELQSAFEGGVLEG